MAMTELTPEQRQLIEQAGDQPVRIEDPETHQAYVIVRADLYERVRDVLEPKPIREGGIPEAIRESQEAFFRDLPELLKNPRLRGQYVAYHRDERVKVGQSETEVIQACCQRGLSDEEYDVFIIEPQSPEPEEVDYPSAWYDG